MRVIGSTALIREELGILQQPEALRSPGIRAVSASTPLTHHILLAPIGLYHRLAHVEKPNLLWSAASCE